MKALIVGLVVICAGSTGCKKALDTSQPPDSKAKTLNEYLTRPPDGSETDGGLGVDTLRSVRGAVSFLTVQSDLNQLYLILSADAPPNNRAPTVEEITAAAKKDLPKIAGFIEEGVIILTGEKTVQGVWAYTKGIEKIGGVVLTGQGSKKVTAEEAKQLLGK